MYIFKEENELIKIIKNQLGYDNVYALDVYVDLSVLNDYTDEDCFIKKNLY